MKITIITPSFNQLPYLKRCIASVADQVLPKAECLVDGCQMVVDQDGETPQQLSNDHSSTEPALQVHHHIQDGGSTDGTVEFLREFQSKVESQKSNVGGEVALNNSTTSNLSTASALPEPRQPSTNNYQLTFASEADEGMYDALNKGISFVLQKQFSDNRQLTTVNCDDEIVAWLNCDEQYLPGALQRVAHFFETRPEVDFVYGDVLMVEPEGALLMYRKNPPLRRAYVQADHLYTQSAAMFFRAVIFSSGIRFNSAWKAVGDCDFIVRTLTDGFRPAQIKEYLAVCTMTGQNISRGSSGVNELDKFRRQGPVLFRAGRPVFNALRYFEKFLRGGYRQVTPLEYDLCMDDSNIRKKIVSETASSRFRWDDHE